MTLARELADTAGRPQVDKNLLINGGMNVWQRNTSLSVSTDNYHTVDRFAIGVGGMGVFTSSRSTDVPSGQGFGYSTKWDCTTADASPAASDYIIFPQRLEGQNLQHLLKGTSSAKAVTVSFWIKSNKTGTYILELIDTDNSRNISKSYTIDTANTWEKKTITFEGDTTGTLNNDNDQSLRCQWWFGAGSNYTSGTLQTSWATGVTANRAVGVVNLADSTSNELYITGCQLEIGEVATDFQFEPYETVLRKCQRYYQTWYTSSGVSAYRSTYGDTYRRFPGHFKVSMRTNPSMSNLTSSNGNFTAEFSNVDSFSCYQNAGNTSSWVRFRSYIASAEL